MLYLVFCIEVID